MRLVADAAAALVDAYENDGPASQFNRVLETGMAVTYVRPFCREIEPESGLPAGRKEGRVFARPSTA